jgi:uncharacterized protein (TIRG00374 family)
MEKPKRRFRRRTLYIALVILFVVAVAVRWQEAVRIVEVLLGSDPVLILLAVLVAVGYWLTQAGVYQAIARAVGMGYGLFDCLALVLAFPFVNVIVPATGLTGVALFADDALQRGMEGEKGVVGGLAYIAADYGSFGLLIWPGLIYLYRNGLMRPYMGWAALVHALGLAGIFLALGLAGWAPQTLRRILDGFIRFGQRLARLFRRPVRERSAPSAASVERFHRAVRHAIGRPRRVLRIVLWAVLGQGVNLLAFFLILSALSRPATTGHLVAGYGITNMITLVSPSPQGIGFTEGSTVALFSSLGEPMEQAVAISLAHRGVTFWMPLLAGFLVVRRLRSFRDNGTVAAAPVVGRTPQPVVVPRVEPPSE